MSASSERFSPGLLGLAALVGAAVPVWVVAVWSLGRHIPQDHMGRDYLAALVWGVVIAAALAFAPIRHEDRAPLFWIWVAKVAVALGFALLYEANYEILDAYGYFVYSTIKGVEWNQWDVGDGTRNTLSIARLHNQLLPDSYHTLKVTWSLLGLIGVYLCYRAAVLFRGRENRKLLLILALFPSSLFWGTTFGKDPLCLLGIGMYAHGVTAWYYQRKSLWVLEGLVGFILATFIRLWLAPIMLVPLFALAAASTRSRIARLAIIGAGGMLVVTLGQYFLLELGFANVQRLLQYADMAQSAMGKGGSTANVEIDLSSPQAVLAGLPLGMFTALFRPLPGDVMNAFGFLASAENLVLLTLLVLAVVRTRLSDLRHPLIIWAIALVLCWSIFYAFVSSQNLGAAVRFRLQILPVFLSLLLYLARRRNPSPVQDVVPAG